jgi:uncharacterized damage-inducible protein DinB
VPDVHRELLRENAGMLRRAVDLLATLDGGLYRSVEPRTGSAGIGQHVRHCLDFYECFLSGLERGRIDYDARSREARIERELDHAMAKLREVADRLDALGEEPLPRVLLVRMDAADGPEDDWARSSPERELQFLASHTVHHLALVALHLRLEHVAVPADLGVGKATARHRDAGS